MHREPRSIRGIAIAISSADATYEDVDPCGLCVPEIRH